MREALAARGVKKGANPKAPPTKAATVEEIQSPSPLVAFSGASKGKAKVLNHKETSHFGPPEVTSSSEPKNLVVNSTDMTVAGEVAAAAKDEELQQETTD